MLLPALVGGQAAGRRDDWAWAAVSRRVGPKLQVCGLSGAQQLRPEKPPTYAQRQSGQADGTPRVRAAVRRLPWCGWRSAVPHWRSASHGLHSAHRHHVGLFGKHRLPSRLPTVAKPRSLTAAADVVGCAVK